MENYPITLVDFKNWVIEQVVIPVLRDCRTKAVMFIGMSELGKTPLVHALAGAISSYWRSIRAEDDQPVGFRTASHLDFFREEPTEVAIPSIFDDGDMTIVSIPGMKAFLDVAGEDTKVYARWGAAQFKKHQWRAACSNAFDDSHEPVQVPAGKISEDRIPYWILDMHIRMFQAFGIFFLVYT